MPFVLDNSVACGWLFENQADDYTEAVARQLVDDRVNAPVLWPMELANVLRTACRRGNLTAQHAQHMLEQVAQLPIEIDPKPPALPGSTRWRTFKEFIQPPPP